MQTTLRNSHLEIQVDSFGAELNHIISLDDRTEYLWQGDPGIWGRRAPVLFPIVGKVSNGMYRFNGKEYPMGQHGFARDEEFELIGSSGDEVTFRLRDRPHLLRVYPFPFELLVSYRLAGSGIAVKFQVRNTGTSMMWFSIGAHPGFSCPIEPGLAFDDYIVEFDRAITASRHLIEDGLIRREAEPFLDGQSTLALYPRLFDHDAIVLKGTPVRHVILRATGGKKFVRVEFPGWPYLGIWTKPGPFLCIEPWYGIADSVSFVGDLAAKEGILRLEPAGKFECTYRIVIGI